MTKVAEWAAQMQTTLLAQTAMLPAARAHVRGIAGSKGVDGGAPLFPAKVRRGVHRYVETAPTSEVEHRKPITAKTRARYAAYLVRLEAELRAEGQRQGLEGDALDAHVRDGLATRAAPLQREISHSTPVRRTQLLDLSKATRP